MALLTVGANGTFKTIAAAVASSKSGDTVAVEAGVYVNDFITIGHSLVLEASGGVAKLVATTSPPNGKAIITEGGNGVHVVLSGLDISGAKVKDGNGAAIRYEGGTLTLKNMVIHDNENGLLAASDPAGAITIADSTFYKNGSGTGTTHNIYVNHVGSLTVDNSTITGAVVGHQVKSRATTTTITNSTIGDGEGGNASYEIDLPNGGVAVVANNALQKGPAAQNPSAIAFGAEGNLHPASSLAVTGNTIANTFASPSASAVRNFTGASVEVTGNALFGWVFVVNGPGNSAGNTTLATDPFAGGLGPPMATPPVVVPPVVVPPVIEPPVVAPPIVVPPVVTPPEPPPVETPPVVVPPPVVPPRGETPPSEPPPVQPPPVVVPPVMTPPVVPPPAEPPPVEPPPVEPPPVVTPPVVPPPAEPPPVEPPPVEVPPVVTPPVVPPPVEPPPVEVPPVVTPPAIPQRGEAPPTEPPAVEVPPVVTPPVAPPPAEPPPIEIPSTPPPRPVFIRDATGSPEPNPGDTPISAGPPAAPAVPDGATPSPDLLPALPAPEADWSPTGPDGGTPLRDTDLGGPTPTVDPWNGGPGAADPADPWLRG